MFIGFFRFRRHFLLAPFLALFQLLILPSTLLDRQRFVEDGIVQIEQGVGGSRTGIHHSLQVVRIGVHLRLRDLGQSHLVLKYRLTWRSSADGMQSPARRYAQLQQTDLLLLRQNLLGRLSAQLLIATIDVVREGGCHMSASPQHSVGYQCVVVKLSQLSLRLAVARTSQFEVLHVRGNVAQGHILFAVSHRTSRLLLVLVYQYQVNHSARCFQSVPYQTVPSWLLSSLGPG